MEALNKNEDNMLESVLTYAASKASITNGVVWGFFVGVLKILLDLQNGNFKKLTAFINMLSSIIAAGMTYYALSQTDATEFIKIVVSVAISINALMLVALSQDRELLIQTVKAVFGIKK